MRSVSAILFLLLYISANTEFHQVLRIPILFTHYYDHQQQNKDISVTDFLLLHYFNGETKTPDFEKHRQLPFKSHCVENFVSIAVLPEKSTEPSTRTFSMAQKIVTPLPVLNTSSFHFSIWQPPKSA